MCGVERGMSFLSPHPPRPPLTTLPSSPQSIALWPSSMNSLNFHLPLTLTPILTQPSFHWPLIPHPYILTQHSLCCPQPSTLYSLTQHLFHCTSALTPTRTQPSFHCYILKPSPPDLTFLASPPKKVPQMLATSTATSVTFAVLLWATSTVIYKLFQFVCKYEVILLHVDNIIYGRYKQCQLSYIHHHPPIYTMLHAPHPHKLQSHLHVQ